MAVFRRDLLWVVWPPQALAAPADAARGERSLGSGKARLTATEFFSLTCTHCASFVREAMPELKARWIQPGRLRWVYYDFPSDRVALQAAMVARYLPPERYERFVDTLFAAQSRWAFGGGNVPDTLWPFAAEIGMDRATFDRALADAGLQSWIVGRAMEAQARWKVDATPSFVIDGKLYTGAMSAREFATILGG